MPEINNKINFSNPSSKSTTHDDGYRLAIPPNPIAKSAALAAPEPSSERYLYRHGNSIFSFGKSSRKVMTNKAPKLAAESDIAPKIPTSIPLPLVPALIFTEVDQPVKPAFYHSTTFIGFLAASFSIALAASHIVSSRLTKQGNQFNTMISTTHSQYQSKVARQDDYQIALRDLEVRLAANPKIADNAKLLILQGMDDYQHRIQLTESNETNGDGKAQLLNQAKALESERDVILVRGSWFDHAQAIFAVAIALSLIAMMTGMTTIAAASILFGVLGAALIANGIYLFWMI